MCACLGTEGDGVGRDMRGGIEGHVVLADGSWGVWGDGSGADGGPGWAAARSLGGRQGGPGVCNPAVVVDL